MPVILDPITLQRIIKPASVIHTESECRVDVTGDTIRLRARSDDWTALMDYSLPVPSNQAPITDEPSSFWLQLGQVTNFLNIDLSDAITITFPFETNDSTIVLESGTLTYRFPSLTDQHAHPVSDIPSSTTVATFTVQHGDFARSVQAADFVGEEMQIRVCPETHHVEFSADSGADGDTFVYPLATERIDDVTGSAFTFTISIDILRNITPRIPSNTPVSVVLTRDYLLYRVEFPVSGAELMLYIAERLSII